MRATLSKRQVDIRLVFNKVIPAFSARFLLNFYNRFLRQQFGGNDLLSIYPFEAYLTKEFEKTPFLTTVFPTSQLAEKTKYFLYDLLATAHRNLLPRAIGHPSRISRFFHRYYMGRWPAIFDLEFVFRLIAYTAIALVGLPLLLRLFNRSRPTGAVTSLLTIFNEEIGGIAIAVLVGWIFIAVLINWVRALDVLLSYSFRSRNIINAVLACCGLAMLCLIATFAMGNWSRWFALLIAGPLIYYLRRGLRNIRLDRCYLEGSFRIVLCLLSLLFFSVATVARK